jgi:hypothetical protein
MRAGTVLILVGAVLVAVGLVARYAPWLVSWFGKLPGDIRYEGESTRVFVPITSMIVVSVAASAIVAIVNRFRG